MLPARQRHAVGDRLEEAGGQSLLHPRPEQRQHALRLGVGEPRAVGGDGDDVEVEHVDDLGVRHAVATARDEPAHAPDALSTDLLLQARQKHVHQRLHVRREARDVALPDVRAPVRHQGRHQFDG